MKLTIIIEDKTVYVNGVARALVPLPLDLSNCGIPSNVWALQWKEVSGWIEFQDNPDGSKPPNETITVLPDWANNCVDVYNAWTPYIAPSVSPSNLPDALQNIEYSQQLIGVNAESPYTITSIGTMPSNLSIENNTIIGIPTTIGTYSIFTQIVDGNGNIGKTTLLLKVV